jgi:DNA-binding transcriptional LysR family regulator
MNNVIESRQLRYFMAVAEELSFGRGAARVGISQAPLSQHIKALEQRLGATLFERTTRSVELTPAGRALLAHAQDIMRRLDSAQKDVKAIVSGVAGKLVVGALPTAMYLYLPRIISEFRSTYPDAAIELLPLDTPGQVAALKEGRIDVGFLRPPGRSFGLKLHRVCHERLVAVLPADHALAAKKHFGLGDLAGENMIGYVPIGGAAYFNSIVRRCREAGFEPVIIQETANTVPLAVLASAGVGIGITPEWVCHLPIPNLTYRQLPELDNIIELDLAMRADEQSLLTTNFVKIAMRHVDAIAREPRRPIEEFPSAV